MLDALRFLMAPPALAVLGAIVVTVAVCARLFRRPGSSRARAPCEQETVFVPVSGKSQSDPFDAFLRSLDRDRGDDR